MRIAVDKAELNGRPPVIEGAVCDALRIQEHWYQGQLNDPCNVVYLKLSGTWYRLYFDHGFVFWRDGDEPPEQFEAPEIEAIYKYVDLGKKLGVEGRKLTSGIIAAAHGGNSVSLTFENGISVEFYCSFKDETGWIAA